MRIDSISFSYDKRKNQLDQVSFEIEAGKWTTIIGPNGCGKSTLLGVMSQNYVPNAGNVLLDGKALHRYKPKELARQLAVVHQHNEVPLDLTVEKLVSFGRLAYTKWFTSPSEEDEHAIEWAMSCTNLQDKRDLKIDRLSGGERQRAWIAMALAQRTPILFLDEPTTYLDMYYQIELLQLVKQLNEEHGITIVMVLHDINQAARFSDTIIVMKDGKIRLKGSPEEVITKQSMEAIYGIDADVRQDDSGSMVVIPIGICSPPSRS